MFTRFIGVLVTLLVVACSIAVLAQSPPASFLPAVNYGAGSSPYFVAVGDFNGDGKLDVAVTNDSSNNVSVLLGKATAPLGRR